MSYKVTFSILKLTTFQVVIWLVNVFWGKSVSV